MAVKVKVTGAKLLSRVLRSAFDWKAILFCSYIFITTFYRHP